MKPGEIVFEAREAGEGGEKSSAKLMAQIQHCPAQRSSNPQPYGAKRANDALDEPVWLVTFTP